MSALRRIEHMFDAMRGETGGGGQAVVSVLDGGEAATVAELEAMASRLVDLAQAARDAAGAWSGAMRVRAIRALDGIGALVGAVRSPLLLAQHDAAEAVGGERAFVDTRARLTGTTRFAAAREVQTAKALDVLPDVGRGVVDQVVPWGHAEVLGRALSDVGERAVDVLTRPGVQERLVELARQTDSREFARHVAALVAERDPDAVADERESARRARHLTLSHGPRGTSLRGFLDPLSGQALARALDATGHREGEERTREQARADALTALAQHALTGGMRGGPGRSAADGSGEAGGAEAHGHQDVVPDGATTAPMAQVSLLVPAETWHEVRRRQQRRRAGGPDEDGQASLTRAVPTPGAGGAQVPPAVSDDGVVVTSAELAAALCDCAMTRVVMDGDGLPLDVGRSRRMFTPAQRVAVVARDRQCAWNGCSTVARYCHVHHMQWWHRDGGRSDLDNAVLLCSHHHLQLHLRDLDVERLPPGGGADDDGGPDPGGWASRGVRYLFRDRARRVVNGTEPDP